MLKKTKTNLIIRGVVFTLLGILCLASPSGTLNGVAWIVGTAMILLGVVNFVLGRRNSVAFGSTMQVLSAVLMVVLGIVIIIRPQIIAIVLGVYVIFEGVDFIIASLRYRKAEVKHWWVMLAIGIIVVLLGLWAVIDYRPSATFLSIVIGLGCIGIAIDCFSAMIGITRVEQFFGDTQRQLSQRLGGNGK